MKKDVELNVITKLKMVLIKIAGRGSILIDFFWLQPKPIHDCHNLTQ